MKPSTLEITIDVLRIGVVTALGVLAFLGLEDVLRLLAQ